VHIGVELMGVGLVGLYALFANVGDGLNGWGLADAAEFVHAAMRVTLVTIGLTALTFVGGFLLPMCVATAAPASIPADGREGRTIRLAFRRP
jgi:hypothetical protein